jgi:hypothetical protein
MSYIFICFEKYFLTYISWDSEIYKVSFHNYFVLNKKPNFQKLVKYMYMQKQVKTNQ